VGSPRPVAPPRTTLLHLSLRSHLLCGLVWMTHTLLTRTNCAYLETDGHGGLPSFVTAGLAVPYGIQENPLLELLLPQRWSGQNHCHLAAYLPAPATPKRRSSKTGPSHLSTLQRPPATPAPHSHLLVHPWAYPLAASWGPRWVRHLAHPSAPARTATKHRPSLIRRLLPPGTGRDLPLHRGLQPPAPPTTRRTPQGPRKRLPP
jgi:hypothetical protein